MCAQFEEILRSSLHTTVGGGCSTENCLAAVSMEAAAVGRCSSASNTGDPGSSNVAEAKVWRIELFSMKMKLSFDYQVYPLPVLLHHCSASVKCQGSTSVHLP